MTAWMTVGSHKDCHEIGEERSAEAMRHVAVHPLLEEDRLF